MAHAVSLATGRRDTDEIEVTQAMIAARARALSSWDAREGMAEYIVADVYRAMASVLRPVPPQLF